MTTPLAAQDKLWKLASNPFVVFGEAHVDGDDLQLSILGDLPAEPRLGLAPGSFPKTVAAAMDMIHPEDRESYIQSVRQSLSTGEPFDMKYRLADGGGSWRWIEGRAVSMEVRDGRHTGWVFTNRDCTRQMDTDLALRQSLADAQTSRSVVQTHHDKLWKLAANALTLLGEADLSDAGFRLEFFGEGPHEQKIGLKPGTIPHSVEELLPMIHPADVEPYQQAIAHIVATGEPLRIIYRLADGYGGWRWLEARGVPLEGPRDGKYLRWVHDTIDITERKETEEALARTVEELHELKAQLQNENTLLREEVHRVSKPAELVGGSNALARVLDQVALVAATSSTVLISGETGTGKELVARAIHQRSGRSKRTFVAVNCAAMPASLVESELFGHEKGAFTGATSRRIGRFEQADGGTLFLDEVGELPLETQAKMLRVLQSGEFERVGGNRPIRTNVRIIAASNRDLENAVREGRFRSDLYHRLSVFPIHLPPLRERREDIPLLAAYLVTRKARQLGRHIERIPDEILTRFVGYDWPGNVRELENVIERAIILSPGTTLRPESIHIAPAPPSSPGARASTQRFFENTATEETLQARERAHIQRVCEATGWKIKGPDGAAQRLGINPGTLYSRMKKLGIARPPDDPTSSR